MGKRLLLLSFVSDTSHHVVIRVERGRTSACRDSSQDAAWQRIVSASELASDRGAPSSFDKDADTLAALRVLL